MECGVCGVRCVCVCVEGGGVERDAAGTIQMHIVLTLGLLAVLPRVGGLSIYMPCHAGKQFYCVCSALI